MDGVRVRAQSARTYRRKYGRALKGQRTHGRTFFSRGKRVSVLPIVSSEGILDWYITKGSVNGERLLDFTRRVLVRPQRRGSVGPARAQLHTHLASVHALLCSIANCARSVTAAALPLAAQVRHLRPFPQKHSVVVFDNFVTHHHPDILDLIHETGALVLFLPPYSPEFSPVSGPVQPFGRAGWE